MVRVMNIERLTLRDMIGNIEIYSGIPDGLIQLPLPEYIFGKKKLSIPKDFKEFAGKICYGQRLFLARKEENDFGSIIRMIDGYYYPLYTKKAWDEDKALLFGKRILDLKVIDLYPVAMHLTSLLDELIDQEQNLLYREPSKIEKAAGIEKLNVFSELTSLDFLRDAMKCTVPEVLLTPYNECLVRFMIAKENIDFQENYYKLIKEESKLKLKYR